MLLLTAVLTVLSVIAPPVPGDTVMLSFADVAVSVRTRSPLLFAERQSALALTADAKQTGLFDNPQFNAEVPLYTKSKNTWFDVGAQGQFALLIQQNIPLSGARGYAQEAGSLRAQAASSDVVQHERGLLLDAYGAYSTLVYARRSYVSLTRQLDLLRGLIKGLDEQLGKGNVALRDVLRIKAAYYAINDERTSILSDIRDARAILEVATGVQGIIVPIETEMDSTAISRLLNANTDALVDSAMKHRADVASALLALQSAEAANTAAQRKGVPSPTVGLMYDQAGSYAPNYYALTLSVPIPAIDRNQWASEATNARIIEARARLDQQRLAVRAEVIAAVNRLQTYQDELENIDPSFVRLAEELTNAIIDNYRKGNVSLLEFVDFIETYNGSIVRIDRLTAARAIAGAQVFYVIGEDPYGR
ncbi:MAG: TolC family protein [Candidatus Kapabacteria bacterium]|nr:TolC family protein [Candidatus Kapabacteria bacterium]